MGIRRWAVGAGSILVLTAAVPAGGQELPARDRVLEPEIDDVYTVGSFDGELWETFGDVNQVAFDDAGNLYVLDPGNHRVVVVDPAGRFLREFGQEGEGPGEWRAPGSMAVLGDGRVVLADAGHRAYQIYGPDGIYERSVPFEQTGGVVIMGRLWPAPDDASLVTAQAGTVRISISSGTGADMPEGRPIRRIDLADGSTESIYSAWRPPAEEGAAPQFRSEGGAVTFSAMGAGPRIFEPGLLVGVLPDGGVAVVDSSAYVVKIVGPDGRERRRVTRPSVRPVPVTTRIEERERQRRIDEIEAGEGPQMRVVLRGAGGEDMSPSAEQMRQMQVNRIREQGFYPEIPSIDGLGAAPTGTLWIRRDSDERPAPGPVDLVGADGSYLGTLAAGALSIPSAFGPDGLVAFIERDDFDVPSVRVSRLPAAIR